MIHEEKDLYAVLGFNSPHETNTDDIRNSYKKLALQYHPDKSDEFGENEKKSWLKI